MKLAPTSCLVITAVLFATSAPGAGPKSIFDDDWTPPTASDTPRLAPVKPVTPDPADPPKVDAGRHAQGPRARPDCAARRAIPGRSEQAAVRQVLKEVFAAQLTDRSVPARRKLTEALLAQAEKSADVPTDQFVLLAAAVDAGTEAASLPLAFQAGDRLAAAFDVDALAIKAETAAKLTPKPGAADLAADNVKAGLALVDELVEADDFAAAARVCSALMPVAAATPALRTQVVQRQRELNAAREAGEKVARHAEKLKTAPDDAAANLEVGKYLCFYKGDWKAGLPALARGSDAALRTLATKELTIPETPEAHAALADAWWEAAAFTAGPAKPAIQSHAAQWYEKALPGLKGLGKAKAETRLDLARATPPAGGGTRSVVAAPSKLEPGLLAFVYARLDGQVDAGAVPADLASFGKPLGPPTAVKSLGNWQPAKENNVVAHGYLMVEQAGAYSFHSIAWWGRYYFVIDGVLLSKFGTDRHTVELALTKGPHQIMMVRLTTPEPGVVVQWRPPGQAALTPLPDGVLFHDAANTRPPTLPAIGRR